jgi:hypothetical protein
VSAPACGTACGPDDSYRVRFRETTYAIPRFNNTGSQATVLVLQNPTEAAVTGRVVLLGRRRRRRSRTCRSRWRRARPSS